MADRLKTLGKWLLYALLAVVALLAFRENAESRRQKDQAVRYAECIKAKKLSPDECSKAAVR